MTEAKLPFHAGEFRAALCAWYRKNGRDLPWRKTRDPYAILVSEFMLQQTQVATVVPYYDRWLQRFPNFESVAQASQNEVLHAWQGLGYYSRARNLHEAAKIVVRKFRGRLPQTVEEIATLPGVGRYTANAIVTFAFDRSAPVVEANTARLLARVFNLRLPIDSAAGRENLWARAAALVPKDNAAGKGRERRHCIAARKLCSASVSDFMAFRRNALQSPAQFNSALIDLGALVCIARKPQCVICPVKRFCRAENPEGLPVKKARPQTRALIESHEFVVKGNRLLLEQSSARWRGMWMLPRLPVAPRNQKPLHVSQFPFTHHRITLNIFTRSHAIQIKNSSLRWFDFDSLNQLALPSPHRRALEAILQQHLVPPLKVA